MNRLNSSIAGLTAVVAGLMAQPTDAAMLKMGDDLGPTGIEYNSGSNSVEIDFEATNNDSGTEYVQFDIESFSTLINQIYNFGNNSSVGTVSDFVNGTTGGENNFGLNLDSNPSYVNSGWQSAINSDGSVTLENPFNTTFNQYQGETWDNTTTSPAVNNTARGTLSIYAGLLDDNAIAANYDFGSTTEDFQFKMSDNPVLAGTAYVGPTPINANAYIVEQQAVIPEPGTLALTLLGLGGLAAISLPKYMGKKE
jgi:hypothetical protein